MRFLFLILLYKKRGYCILVYNLYPTDYGEVFRFIMDEFTDKQNKSTWIEKSPRHAHKLDLILSLYPDALFLATRRELKDVVKLFQKKQAQEV